jgi:hypothetical protein
LLNESLSRPSFFSSGVTDANLYLSGNLPSANDSVMSRVTSTANVSAQVLITEVGMLSNGKDLAGIGRIALRASSTVGGCTSVSIAASCLTSNSNGSRLKLKPQLVTYRFRSLKNVDWTRFQNDLHNTDLFVNPATSADDFAEQLDAVVVEMLDRHCPLHERKRFMSARRENRWLSAAAVDAKRQRRRLERQWKATGRDDHYVAYRKSCRVTNKIIVESRGAFYNDRIEAASADPRRRWAAIRNVLHLTESRQVRSNDDNARLFTGFSQFFVYKIRSIMAALKERLGATYNDPLEFDVRHDTAMFIDVQPPTVDEVLRAIRSMPAKSSPLDSIPIPTSVIKTFAEIC